MVAAILMSVASVCKAIYEALAEIFSEASRRAKEKGIVAEPAQRPENRFRALFGYPANSSSPETYQSRWIP